MIRIGIIGTSLFVERAYLPNLKRVANVEVTAICGRNRERLDAVADKYGVAKRFTDYQELVESDEVQAVCIVTPPALHYPMVMDALSKGKHVLCEKPMAMNYGQAIKMLDTAEIHGLRHMIPFTWRFTPAAIRMKELINEGYLGKIFHVEARYLAGWMSDASVPASWHTEKAMAGTGAMGDTGSHLIDFVRWMAGEFASVVADTEIFIKERPIESKGKKATVEVEDSAVFLGRLAGGAQVMAHCSRVARGRDNYISVEINGERGTLIFKLEVEGKDWAVGRLFGSDDVKRRPELLSIPDCLLVGFRETRENPTGGEFLFAAIIRRFVEGIDLGGAIIPNFSDGARVQAVMDAVQFSAAEKRWVNLGEVEPKGNSK